MFTTMRGDNNGIKSNLYWPNLDLIMKMKQAFS